jgi:thiol-disulfide isomerase/thioredoxin
MESAAGVMSKFSALKGGLSTTHIVYLLAAVLFIVISVSFYYYYFKPKYLAQSYTPNSEHDQDSGESNNTAELMLFYVDWCPHCKTAKPDWDEVKAQFQNKTINGYQVVFTEINCTTETEEVEKLMNKYKVEGYPTIKLIKDGQVIEYDAKPSKDTLIQFLNTVL